MIWSCDPDLDDSLGFNERGFAGIDAHNGQVIWHASVNGAK
jgi:hypothetical protein